MAAEAALWCRLSMMVWLSHPAADVVTGYTAAFPMICGCCCRWVTALVAAGIPVGLVVTGEVAHLDCRCWNGCSRCCCPGLLSLLSALRLFGCDDEPFVPTCSTSHESVSKPGKWEPPAFDGRADYHLPVQRAARNRLSGWSGPLRLFIVVSGRIWRHSDLPERLCQ